MPNKQNAQTIACDVCGHRGAQTKYMTRTYGKGANLLVIENVPMVVCPSCGESYLTAETLHELERIKLHRRSLAKPRSVAVASFIRASSVEASSGNARVGFYRLFSERWGIDIPTFFCSVSPSAQTATQRNLLVERVKANRGRISSWLR